MIKYFKYIFLLCLSSCLTLSAQHQENSDQPENLQHRVYHHKLGAGLGHTHISRGKDADGIKWRNVPSFAVIYDYHFNGRWSLGIHTDIIVETFEVETNLRNENDEEFIERKNPIAPTLMATYKFTDHSSVIFGGGFEYAPEETLSIFRVGYEWSTHLNEKWELAIPFTYDFRLNAYDSWSLSLIIARMW
ncbi:hypothetical protein OO013_05325 [Mangrovivirga sp. M17]|uniref:Outer membrane protein beta-barrel domain-containing protein n=1 Tax=Mangrovivirga halotolerans TaxID=2993936 RepID=A0ABT3RPI1_9BACT|nr:hypothetical protein [Mangrovivirga halotolerans]MCX2743274.1 hypothetical protein [Mangrovivirga halotolerans]